MSMRRGFTIVELVITVTIIGILLTLVVVNMSSAQVNARDSERKADVEAIALSFEAYNNNDVEGLGLLTGNTYPGVNYIYPTWLTTVLPFAADLDPKSYKAPAENDSDTVSLVPATNNIQTTAGILPRPSASNDVYVYQAILGSGALCNDPVINGSCRKFNIFYYQEADNSVKMITSKNQ